MASLNLQQQPKTKEYLACFKARPGHKLVSMDYAALEMKIAAYFSRDPNLLKLYGPGAKQNDIYLYNGSKMGTLGDPIRAAGYDPDDPTPAGISAAKKAAKLQRSIAKQFTLSAQYGAGPGKIHMSLLQDGVPVTFKECVAYHRAFWKLYAQLKDFGERLKRQWDKNGGYIINGRGRPLAVDSNSLKDITNRFIQSTGHDLLMHLILHLTREAKDIPWEPFIIDYHDESIVEVPEAHVPEMVAAFERARQKVIDALGWDVTMDGEVLVANNLAEIKVED